MTMSAGPKGPNRADPGWRRWFTWVSLVSAGFTTLCCLGISVALSLASAIGATFLTRDATLRPILVGTLALTVAASVLTYRLRHRIAPLLITVASAIWVYGFTFLFGASHGGHAQGDNMTGTAGAHTGLSGGRLILVWVGLGVLVAAQLWDLVGHRRSQAIERTSS
jgi:hypothetical protein